MTDRLLCVLDHPTQYDPPLWRAMERSCEVKPHVLYLRSTAPDDPEIEQAVGWQGDTNSYLTQSVALSDIADSIVSLTPRPLAVLTAGWTRPSTVQAMLGSRRAGIPVIQPSDKTLNERSPTGLARTALTVFHASRIRSVQGFFTTGLLGTNALRSIGASAEHIVPGLYPIDVNHWQTQRAAFRSRSLSYRQTLGGKFIVLAVSKWSERENPLQVVDAFAELLLTCPESRLVYVGDGPLRDRVRRRIKARKLEPFVTLPGYVPYDELPLYYGCADVFVHAPECEPWGISVLEAMASSVPVIANTTVGAAADLVIPGITGDLSYAGSSSSLAAALRRMHTWMEHRPLGANALERVRRFDVHKAAENLQDLCWKLTSGKPAHDDFSKILISDLRNAFGRWPT